MGSLPFFYIFENKESKYSRQAPKHTHQVIGLIFVFYCDQIGQKNLCLLVPLGVESLTEQRTASRDYLYYRLSCLEDAKIVGQTLCRFLLLWRRAGRVRAETRSAV
jgi:hypothetical protein